MQTSHESRHSAFRWYYNCFPFKAKTTYIKAFTTSFSGRHADSLKWKIQKTVKLENPEWSISVCNFILKNVILSTDLPCDVCGHDSGRHHRLHVQMGEGEGGQRCCQEDKGRIRGVWVIVNYSANIENTRSFSDCELKCKYTREVFGLKVTFWVIFEWIVVQGKYRWTHFVASQSDVFPYECGV